MSLKESPSQTAGPYVHIGCTPNVDGMAMYGGDLGASMKTGPVQGTEITVTGTVYDGQGEALKDALIEIWQADAGGIYPGQDGADPNFAGLGRSAGDMATGAFQFDTVKPGSVDGQAPYITFWIVARGINLGLHTRMYFEGDDLASDPLMNIVPVDRRATLIASKTNSGYRFDIHLQGPQETVFLDI